MPPDPPSWYTLRTIANGSALCTLIFQPIYHEYPSGAPPTSSHFSRNVPLGAPPTYSHLFHLTGAMQCLKGVTVTVDATLLRCCGESLSDSSAKWYHICTGQKFIALSQRNSHHFEA